MGSTCTCPKLNEHSYDQDEKQQQAPVLVCTFGNVLNGVVPFCIENLSAAMYDMIEIFNLDKVTYDNRWNINLFIASSTSCNKDATQQKWQKYTRNVTPKPIISSEFHFFFTLIIFLSRCNYNMCMNCIV